MSTETKECPFCAEEILARAIKCKHCGSDVGQAPLPSQEDASARKRGPVGWAERRMTIAAMGCLIVLLLVVAWWSYMSLTSESREIAGLRANDEAAWTACQHAVRDRLLSPATASFPPGWRDGLTRLFNQRTFRWYVDATNRMGGTARLEFACGISELQDGTWEVFSLDLEEQ